LRWPNPAISQFALIFVLAFAVPSIARGQSQPSINCQLIAQPPPLATLGGPSTAGSGSTELALAAGGYGEILPSPCFHGGASDWLVRWRRGLGDRFDLGFDGEVDTTGSNVGGTIKLAARYQLVPGLRLEAGIGASDGGIGGRSVNGDVAAVIGTRREDRTWNYYGSLRLAASRGCVNLFCAGGSGGHSPGAILPLVVGGATARVSKKARFVMEGSPFGGIISREHPGFGYYVHIAVGVLFEVGKRP
jgi:hypothetical protein